MRRSAPPLHAHESTSLRLPARVVVSPGANSRPHDVRLMISYAARPRPHRSSAPLCAAMRDGFAPRIRHCRRTLRCALNHSRPRCPSCPRPRSFPRCRSCLRSPTCSRLIYPRVPSFVLSGSRPLVLSGFRRQSRSHPRRRSRPRGLACPIDPMMPCQYFVCACRTHPLIAGRSARQ